MSASSLRCAFVAYAILLPVAAQQGPIVTGRLTGPGGFPLAGATVRVVETGARSLSNHVGGSGLSNIPEGVHAAGTGGRLRVCRSAVRPPRQPNDPWS